jgi:pyruvate,water dikinase
MNGRCAKPSQETSLHGRRRTNAQNGDITMIPPDDDAPLIELDSPLATLERVGGKGASLARLAAAGLPVPPGFHITTAAYRRFVTENHLTEPILAAAAAARPDDHGSLERASERIQSLFAASTMPADLAALCRQWHGRLGPDDPAVAVRSSATAEDLPEMSFAGQQETFLNVRGDNVLDAVARCWASLWTARALGYRARLGIRPAEVAIAVVVQELVPADVAGVLFTANPLTGARDQMVINAAWGLGEAIVGGQVTPDTYIVNRQTDAIESREIADKQVMTVKVLEGTREDAVPDEQRKQPTLEPAQAIELVCLGDRIEQLFNIPVDIEWALAAGRFFILQTRPITALPKPRATLDWALPDPKGRYARSSVIELLPDPLSPLFATVALPAWNEAYRAMARMLGFEKIFPEHFVLMINDFAYYDASTFRGLQMLWFMPRVMFRGIGWIRRARQRWADEARPRYAEVVARWDARDTRDMPAISLVDGAGEITRAAAEHYLTIQSGILPAAYMSESLFSLFYAKLIKRKDDPPPLTFLLGYDSAPIQAEKSLYDLATWARSHPELAGYLAGTSGSAIAHAVRQDSSPISDAASWREFRERLSKHLVRYGHAIYDLDFTKSLAAEEPAPLLETLRFFLTGQARSPHERQATAAAAREQATEMILGRIGALRRRWFTRLLRWAQGYAPLREDALADVGLGWPLLRRMMREVGRRLVAAGSLSADDDVFWLRLDELETAARALDSNQPPESYQNAVVERRAIWQRERTVTPPVVLPIKGGARFMGIDFTRWMPAFTDQPAGDAFKGTGASPGRFTGTARVISGPDEFDRMQQGEILVAKITTPAWTPLFALAAGIVTDVGGPLSHGSIVAREYQIPAVLGTGVATERLHSGQSITVDCDAGVVKLGG